MLKRVNLQLPRVKSNFKKIVEFSLPSKCSLKTINEDSWLHKYNFFDFLRSKFGIEFEYYYVDKYSETYCLSSNKEIAIVDGNVLADIIIQHESYHSTLNLNPHIDKVKTFEYNYYNLYKFFSLLNDNWHMALRAKLVSNGFEISNNNYIDFNNHTNKSDSNINSINYFINKCFPIFHELGHWLSSKTDYYKIILEIFTEEICIHFIESSVSFIPNKWDQKNRDFVMSNLHNESFIFNVKNVQKEIEADVAGTMLLLDFMATVPHFKMDINSENINDPISTIKYLFDYSYKFYIINGIYADTKVSLNKERTINMKKYFDNIRYSPILLECRRFAMTTALTHRIAQQSNLDSDFVFENYIKNIFNIKSSLEFAYIAANNVRKNVFYEKKSNFELFEENILNGNKYPIQDTSKLLMQYFEQEILLKNKWCYTTSNNLSVQNIW